MSKETEDCLGAGWGWFIIFLTLCIISSCDQDETNKKKIDQLQYQIQQLKSEESSFPKAEKRGK